MAYGTRVFRGFRAIIFLAYNIKSNGRWTHATCCRATGCKSGGSPLVEAFYRKGLCDTGKLRETSFGRPIPLWWEGLLQPSFQTPRHNGLGHGKNSARFGTIRSQSLIDNDGRGSETKDRWVAARRRGCLKYSPARWGNLPR
jgi:hypothetical protein